MRYNIERHREVIMQTNSRSPNPTMRQRLNNWMRAKEARALVYTTAVIFVITACYSNPASVVPPLPTLAIAGITETSIRVTPNTPVTTTSTTAPPIRTVTTTPNVVPQPSATLAQRDYAIAYVAMDNSRSELRLSDLRGVTSILLNSATNSLFLPKWSPDGLRVAYLSRSRATDEMQLCVLLVLTEESFCTNANNITGYDWSPDGQEIVFAGDFIEGDNRYAIYRLDVIKQNRSLLYALDMQVVDLQWSPLGSQMLVLVESSETPLRFVYLLSLNGRLQELVLNAVPEFLRWHPSGLGILYDNRLYPAYQQRDIHLVGVDGSNDQSITNTGKFTYDPVLSPARNLMAYQAYSETEQPRIYILDLSSGQTIAVSPENLSSWYPSWSPDGNYLAFLSQIRDGAKPDYSLHIFSVDDQQSTPLVNEGVALFRPAWRP